MSLQFLTRSPSRDQHSSTPPLQSHIRMATREAAPQKKINITSIALVFPKDPSSPHRDQLLDGNGVLRLSNLDRQCPAFMYFVLFYDNRPALPPMSPLCNGQTEDDGAAALSPSALKAGLEETLSAWYPAAGRLHLNPKDGKLDLLCNDAGALLVEAETEVAIAELGDLSRYNSFYENLVHRPSFSGDFLEMPLLAAQVTRFRDGGFALGLGVSLSLFDEFGIYNFLRAWASNVSGRKEEQSPPPSPSPSRTIVVEPTHDRSRLLPGEHSDNHRPECSTEAADSNNNKEPPRILAFNHLIQLILQAQATPPQQTDAVDKDLGWCKSSDMSCINQDGFLLTTIALTDGMVDKLMSRVTETGRTCSTFEVVAAQLWQARVKALGLDKDRMVCLQLSENARTRITPPLPQGFTGNAVVLCSISSTAGEVAEADLADLIQKIKDAQDSIDGDYVRSYVEELNGIAPQNTPLPPLKELTIVSDWREIPYHEVDFGHGKPSYVFPVASPLPQAAFVMQSPDDTAQVNVRISLFPSEVKDFPQFFLDMV